MLSLKCVQIAHEAFESITCALKRNRVNKKYANHAAVVTDDSQQEGREGTVKGSEIEGRLAGRR